MSYYAAFDIPINSLARVRELVMVLFGKPLREQPRNKVRIRSRFFHF